MEITVNLMLACVLGTSLLVVMFVLSFMVLGEIEKWQ